MILYYLVKSFYWGADGFVIEVSAGTSAGNNAVFTLTFGSPVEARQSIRGALAAAANSTWGCSLTAADVRAMDPSRPDAPEDDLGRPLVRLGSTTAAGLANVTVQNITDDCQAFRRSWLIPCEAKSITLRDICISNNLVGATGYCFVTSSFFACATPATIGSELQIDLIDRDDVLGYFGYYGIPRSKIVISGVTGTFLPGEQIRSATCRSKVLAVSPTELEVTYDRWDALGRPATFTPGEVVTGQTSGATATYASFAEGGFIFIQRFIQDEAIYGTKSHEEKPGGARPVPPGLYFRCAVYNNGDTTLWMDGTISVGKK